MTPEKLRKTLGILVRALPLAAMFCALSSAIQVIRDRKYEAAFCAVTAVLCVVVWIVVSDEHGYDGEDGP